MRRSLCVHALAALLGSWTLTGCALDRQAGSDAQAGAPAGEVHPDQLARQAVDLLKKNRLAEASDMINKALQQRIDRSYYHLINGIIYHLQAVQGNRAAFDVAEQGYSQAINFDRTNWLAYYYRGRMRLDLGEFARGKADLAEALIFRPSDKEILTAFAYAAYRSGAPDEAAAAVEAMEKAGGPLPRSALRTAALTMAALNQTDRAALYYKSYEESAPGQERDLVRRRMGEWGDFNRIAPSIQPVQYGSAYGNAPSGGGTYGGNPYSSGSYASGGYGQSSEYGEDTALSLPARDVPTAPGSEDKMVVIDVIMIGTSEDVFTAKGVNLLSGLSIQFGGNPSGSGVSIPAFSRTVVKETEQATITRALTIPAVTYTLNILNANNQNNQVLARPTLIGLAGKPSEFFSGVELDAAAVASANVGGQSINIQKEIGVKLLVIPSVLPDGRLKLHVFAQRTFLQSPSNNVNFQYQIQTSKDKVTANVVMRYGETLILGGLSLKEDEVQRDGVPGLQEVPLVQYLFSRQQTRSFQSSVLILMTPRPPQYVYQPEAAREEYDKSLTPDQRSLENLRSRYSDWFRPYPNWAAIFRHLQGNSLYREFRTGDVELETWSDMRLLTDRLQQALEFLHY